MHTTEAHAVSPPPALAGKGFFSDAQKRQVAIIFEAIWPRGAANPGAGDAGAADYLDSLLGLDDSIYYEIPAWRPLYTDGLARLNGAALNRPGMQKPLEELTAAQVTLLLT